MGSPFGWVDTWWSCGIFLWVAEDCVGCDDRGIDGKVEVLANVGVAAIINEGWDLAFDIMVMGA